MRQAELIQRKAFTAHDTKFFCDPFDPMQSRIRYYPVNIMGNVMPVTSGTKLPKNLKTGIRRDVCTSQSLLYYRYIRDTLYVESTVDSISLTNFALAILY